MIACGARRFLEVGMAGAIQPNLNLGDILVVTEAIRDEGTSNHYFSPEVKLESNEDLRKRIIEVLEEEKLHFRTGSVWTTDGVYRETKSKFLRFRDQGVLAVDMETSALFAVAKYRKMQIASMQVVSDILSESGWLPAFKHKEVAIGLQKAITCAVHALSKS
jgi:uridine phosphorylase